MNPDMNYLTDPEALALTAWIVAAPLALLVLLGVLIFYVRRLASSSVNEEMLVRSIPVLTEELEVVNGHYASEMTDAIVERDAAEARAFVAGSNLGVATGRVADLEAALDSAGHINRQTQLDVVVLHQIHERTKTLGAAARAEVERRYLGINADKVPAVWSELFDWLDQVPNVQVPERFDAVTVPGRRSHRGPEQ